MIVFLGVFKFMWRVDAIEATHGTPNPIFMTSVRHAIKLRAKLHNSACIHLSTIFFSWTWSWTCKKVFSEQGSCHSNSMQYEFKLSFDEQENRKNWNIGSLDNKMHHWSCKSYLISENNLHNMTFHLYVTRNIIMQRTFSANWFES